MSDIETLRTAVEFFTQSTPGRIFVIFALVMWIAPWLAMFGFYRAMRANANERNAFTTGLMKFSAQLVEKIEKAIDKLTDATVSSMAQGQTINQGVIGIKTSVDALIAATDSVSASSRDTRKASQETMNTTQDLERSLAETIIAVSAKLDEHYEKLVRRIDEACADAKPDDETDQDTKKLIEMKRTA